MRRPRREVHRVLCGPEFERIVFDPARMRKVLREFTLRGSRRKSRAIEDDRAGTRGPAIESENEGHGRLLQRGNVEFFERAVIDDLRLQAVL